MSGEPAQREGVWIRGSFFSNEVLLQILGDNPERTPLWMLWMLPEAVASTSLDRNPEGGTRVIEGAVTVGKPEELP